ncbi:hypothetical protein [Flagellimonas aurea]|uniref:hypothetical protein n=1 Tax=Flagellimonas aurea TaxID=2915619 RepID=UPI0035CFCBC4
MMKFYISLLLLLCSMLLSGMPCSAQEGGRPLQVSYGYMPLDGDATVSEWEAALLLPISKGTGFDLIGGLYYNAQSLVDFPMDIGRRLVSTGIPLGARVALNGRDHLFIASRLLLSSDFKDISSEALTFSIGTGLIRKLSETLSLGVGMGYSRQFFGNQLLPFVDIEIEVSKKVRLNGRFPLKGDITYGWGSRSGAGWEWNLGAQSYRLSDAAFDGNYIRHSRFQTNVFYQYRFYKGFRIKLAGGFVAQRYQMYDDLDSNGWSIITISLSGRKDPLEELEYRGGFVQLGIFYAF